MNHGSIEFPETQGRTIERIRYLSDPSGPPEVDIRFTDGASLSIRFHVGLKAEGELYQLREGDMDVMRRYPEVETPGGL